MKNINYVFHWAEWLPAPEPELDNLSLEEWLHLDYEAPVSDKIDDRTMRSKFFETEYQALEFAEKKRHEGDRWLAYVEVKKCTVELVHKVL